PSRCRRPTGRGRSYRRAQGYPEARGGQPAEGMTAACRSGSLRRLSLVLGPPNLVPVGGAQLYRPDLDHHLADHSGEPVVAGLVVVRHRRLTVYADVGPLVRREGHSLRPVDPSLAHLLAVEDDRPGAAHPEAAAVVGELEPDRRLPGGCRLGGGDLVGLQAEVV